MALTPAFSHDPDKQAQWEAFIRRQPFEQEMPTLDAAVEMITALLQPLIRNLMEGHPFVMN